MDFKPRKLLFVDSQIQGVLLRRFCFIWFGYHLVLWHFMFLVWLFQQRIGGSALNAYQQFAATEPMLLIVAVAAFPPVLWGWLSLSHRIVGPLVQLRNCLYDMADGKPAKPLALRTGDLMTGLQMAFNKYVAHIDACERDSVRQSTENCQVDDAVELLRAAGELTTITRDVSSMDAQDATEPKIAN